MSNIRKFSSKDTIRLQACEWISKFDRGLDHNEQQKFAAWVNVSETHRQYLFDMAKTWDDMSVLRQLKGLFPLQTTQVKATRFKSMHGLKNLAASLFVVAGLAWLVTAQVFNPSEPTSVVALNLHTQVGEERVINLADGSAIHLNTNSRLTVDFSETHRQITLHQGEAHFDVAHDQQRPFIVTAANRTVTAVGTAFNVQIDNQQGVELIVTDGKVLVKAAQKTGLNKQQKPFLSQGEMMSAGYKAIISEPELQQASVSKEQIQRDLAWQQGMLVFHGEPLVDALHEIARYTPIQFDLADERVKQRRVAGYFKAGDIPGLLFALENNFNISYQKLDEQTIVLSSGDDV